MEASWTINEQLETNCERFVFLTISENFLSLFLADPMLIRFPFYSNV